MECHTFWNADGGPTIRVRASNQIKIPSEWVHLKIGSTQSPEVFIFILRSQCLFFFFRFVTLIRL